MTCRLEWDPLAGPMCHPMPILTLAPPILCGRGGVAGEEAGGVAEAAGLAGAGLHLTGTRGGRTAN